MTDSDSNDKGQTNSGGGHGTMRQERLTMFATVDADGMVTIPPAMLLALGWKAGDTLLCRPGDGLIRFVKVADPSLRAACPKR
jgi:hypothetical protein